MVSLHKRVYRTIIMGGKQMDAVTLACAPSGVTWNDIPWAIVQRQVRRLQARIVKATQDGRHNKAKALQWLLTHSFSGKALAVKRVTENKGKNTPGVDKVTWKRDSVVEEAGLLISSASESINFEEKWQNQTTRYTCDEVSRHASIIFSGAGAHCGNHSRSELLRVQTTTLNSRCRGAMF
jgi:hypothetical protein